MKQAKQLSSWCYRAVNCPVLVAAVIIFVFFLVVVLPGMAGGLSELAGTDVSPDTSFIYSAEELYGMAEMYGEEGRSYYIYSRFTFDLIWPAAYLFFLAASVSYLFRYLHPNNHWRLVNLLPFAGAVFDILENSAASLVMYRYPLPTAVIAQLAPIFTFIKWFFIVLSFLALVAGFVLSLLRLLQNKKVDA